MRRLHWWIVLTAIFTPTVVLAAPTLFSHDSWLHAISPPVFGGAPTLFAPAESARLANRSYAAAIGVPTRNLQPLYGASGSVVWPAQLAVWSGGAAFAGDANTFGATTYLNAAKPLSPAIDVGAHFALQLAGADRFDVGAGLGFGIAWHPIAEGRFAESRVLLSMTGIGKPLHATAGLAEAYPAFTPSAAIVLPILRDRGVRLDLSSRAALSEFRSLSIGAAARLQLADRVGISLSWQMPAAAIGSGRLDWPALAVEYRVPTSRARVGGGFGVDAAGGLYSVIAVGYEDLPARDEQIRIEAELLPAAEGRSLPTVHLSAGHHSGIAHLELSAVDQADGTVLRRDTFRPTATTAAPVTAGTLAERLAAPIRSETARIVWSVTYDDLFGFSVHPIQRTIIIRADAVAGDGRTTTLEVGVVQIDTRTPTVAVTAEQSMAIAGQVPIRFRQEVRDASRATGAIVDGMGNVVREYQFVPPFADSVEWDATDTQGRSVGTGFYRYRVSATDDRGALVQGESAPVAVRSIQPQLTVRLSHSAVSPGTRDSEVAPALQPLVGLEQWQLVLVDAGGIPVRRWDGVDLPPERLLLDRNSLRGVPDGIYRFRLTADYLGGLTVAAESGLLEIDRREPTASIRLEQPLIVADADGPETRITVYQDVSKVANWSLILRNADANIVRTVSWPEEPPFQFAFDPIGDDGRPLSDGNYTLTLRGVDHAGNTGQSAPVSFRLERRSGSPAVAASPALFSPNDDGRLDTTTLRALVPPALQPTSFAFEIRQAGVGTESSPLRVFSGQGVPPANVVWDGRDGQGRRVADGQYAIRLRLTFADGTERMSSPFNVQLHTVAPVLRASVGATVIAPNTTRGTSSTAIELAPLRSPTAPLTLLAEVLNEAGARVWQAERRWESGGPWRLSWDGRDSAGNLLADGRYQVVATARDQAGNETRSIAGQVEVLTRPVSLFVVAGDEAISPNGDGFRDALDFRVFVAGEDLLETLTLTVENEAERTVWEAPAPTRGAAGLPTPWVVRFDGAGLPDGRYRAVARAAFRHVDEVRALTPWIRIDTTAPRVELQLSPQPFSPDGDGVEDELTLELRVVDDSPLRHWHLKIFDRNGAFFHDFGGRGDPPATIRWNGVARNGERVLSAERYPVELEVVDELGNRSLTRASIEVDVLVDRVDGRLRMQIPSIVFAPNSPTLLLDPADPAGRNNLRVLERLVVVFQRFPSYRIRVEGHAVNISGTEREEREELLPLSLQRAQSVRAALIARGVGADVIEAAGMGGLRPLVAHSDEINRWKNRRVDFVLIR